MSVVCRSYTDEGEARRAVDALLAAGIPGEGIRVLMGEPARDARAAPEGEFAGTTTPGDVVGDFAGPGHRRDVGAGAFAGMAEAQRGGSFADADRETVASYPGGVERQRVAGHRDLRRLLIEAGLDEAAADRDVAALHEGRILVLADVGDRSAEEMSGAFGA
jgi:hypothetical protein